MVGCPFIPVIAVTSSQLITVSTTANTYRAVIAERTQNFLESFLVTKNFLKQIVSKGSNCLTVYIRRSKIDSSVYAYKTKYQFNVLRLSLTFVPTLQKNS